MDEEYEELMNTIRSCQANSLKRPVIIIDDFDKLIIYEDKEAIDLMMTASELHNKYAFAFIGG